MKGKVWNTICKPAKDLIRKMMCFDPKKRITAIQALNHEWFYLGTDP
jgi:calcium-dependent protein kinase